MNAHTLLITLALSFVAFTSYGAEQPVGAAQTLTTTAGSVILKKAFAFAADGSLLSADAE